MQLYTITRDRYSTFRYQRFNRIFQSFSALKGAKRLLTVVPHTTFSQFFSRKNILDTDAHTTQVNKYKKRSPLSTYLFGKGKEFVTISSQAVSYANTIIDSKGATVA